MSQNNKQIGQIIPYNNTIKLDKKYQKLLSLLMINARTYYSQLAKALHISKSNVMRRISQLEQQKILTGYHAFIDVSQVGIQSAILLLQTKTTEDVKEQCIKKIQNMPLIYSIVELTGKYDLLITFYYNAEKEKDALIEDILNIIEFKDFYCVPHTTEFPQLNYFSEYNPKTKIPAQTTITKCDKTHFRILAMLSHNCRETSVKMSISLKISRETINYRIKKLIQAGIIAKFQPTINLFLLGFESYFMTMKLCKPTQRHKIIQFFKETQKCNTILLSALGDIMAFIHFPNNKDYRMFENKLFSQFESAIHEYSFALVKNQHKLEWFPEELISYKA